MSKNAFISGEHLPVFETGTAQSSTAMPAKRRDLVDDDQHARQFSALMFDRSHSLPNLAPLNKYAVMPIPSLKPHNLSPPSSPPTKRVQPSVNLNVRSKPALDLPDPTYVRIIDVDLGLIPTDASQHDVCGTCAIMWCIMS